MQTTPLSHANNPNLSTDKEPDIESGRIGYQISIYINSCIFIDSIDKIGGDVWRWCLVRHCGVARVHHFVKSQGVRIKVPASSTRLDRVCLWLSAAIWKTSHFIRGSIMRDDVEIDGLIGGVGRMMSRGFWICWNGYDVLEFSNSSKGNIFGLIQIKLPI